MSNHRFVEASGTTSICGCCGCIMYCCRCCTKGFPMYSRWVMGRWAGTVWKASRTPPRCDPTRTVPEWVKDRMRQPGS